MIASDEDIKKFLSIPYEPVEPDLTHFFKQEKRIGNKAALSLIAPEPLEKVASLFLWEDFVKKVFREKISL